MSIRIGLCRFFLFFSFIVLVLVLVCVVGLGWKSGKDGWVWKVGRVRGWQGEVVYYWQNGGGFQFGGRGRGVTANK